MASTKMGCTVHYVLSEDNANSINRRRKHAAESGITAENTGAVVHYGNPVYAGDEYPMVIVKEWTSGGSVNGQVLLDGNDTFWACSVSEGEGPGKYHIWELCTK